MFEIKFEPTAKRFLKKLDKHEAKKILTKIKKLKNNPKLGKPLIGNLSGLWRLRIEEYRVIYQIKNNELIIFVLDIGLRKNIY
ncbi:MAG: type II toxin-antitoxin system RelE/ParE family toxin [Candidatus Pacearchaeota archaeon]|nr:type II toxin-antitoxin system RelE/ParE family toxin [Candidatus Pacearchaeota archaeon]